MNARTPLEVAEEEMCSRVYLRPSGDTFIILKGYVDWRERCCVIQCPADKEKQKESRVYSVTFKFFEGSSERIPVSSGADIEDDYE